MSGASQRHNRLVGTLFVRLWGAAQGIPCTVYASDMKVRVGDNIIYYPDVVVTCAEEPHPYYIEQPCLIVEVLSPSTAGTDRREKLQNYRRLETLQAYILLDTETARAEGYYRTAEGWLHRLVEDEGICPFPALR